MVILGVTSTVFPYHAHARKYILEHLYTQGGPHFDPLFDPFPVPPDAEKVGYGQMRPPKVVQKAHFRGPELPGRVQIPGSTHLRPPVDSGWRRIPYVVRLLGPDPDPRGPRKPPPVPAFGAEYLTSTRPPERQITAWHPLSCFRPPPKGAIPRVPEPPNWTPLRSRFYMDSS